MSEDLNLEVTEIAGVAMAGIRGAAFSDIADELVEKTGAVVDTYKELISALEAATENGDFGSEVTAEDRAVVDAAKAYARAEVAYLSLIQGYLSFVQPYSLGLLFGPPVSEGAESALSALKGLIPDV